MGKMIEIGPHAREAMSPEKRQKKRGATSAGASTAGTTVEHDRTGARGDARGQKRAQETDTEDEAEIQRQRKEHSRRE